MPNTTIYQTITPSHVTAIRTRYVGPTSTTPARIKADAGMGRTLMVSYHVGEAEETFDAHARAARALCAKFDWAGDMIAGGTETGYCFVFVPEVL
ncbi:MAG: hypothetical protein INH43_03015 [Acidobacteriaceae bacterium]|nr:hypothetical protein [Acidobacteriaceae bacterium]